MKQFNIAVTLALALTGVACAGTTATTSTTSSSGGSGGTASSAGGQTSSRASGSSGTSGASGTSGGSGTSGTSGGSGTSGTSGGSGGPITGSTLGGPCDPDPMADHAACEGLATGAQCVGLQNSDTGICGVPGCTAGEQNCAGTGTTCVGMGQNTLCVKSCNIQGGDDQCGGGAACVNFAPRAACYPSALADCNYETMTGCAAGETCNPVGTDGYGQCAAGCDVFTQECAEGSACYPNPDGTGSCAQVATAGVAGDACTGPQQCGEGLTCAGSAQGMTFCRVYCHATDHPCEAMGTNCATIVMSTGLGVCIPGM